MPTRKRILILLICFNTLLLQAQTTVTKPTAGDPIGRILNEEVMLNLTTGTITPQSLPFDVPFLLVGEVPREITKITLTIIEKGRTCPNGDCDPVCLPCRREGATTSSVAAISDGMQEIILSTMMIMKDLAPDDQKKIYADSIEKVGKNKPTETNNVKAPCACDECFKPDFTTCQTLCPWEASFLSQTKSNTVEVNKFSIAVPALKANRQYKFFIHVERSNGAEKDVIKGLVVPILRSSFFNEYNGAGSITLANQSTLQQRIRDAIVVDYRDRLKIPNVSTVGQLIDVAQIAFFQNLLKTETGNSKTLLQHYGDITTEFADITTYRNSSTAKFTALMNNNYTHLAVSLSMMEKPSAAETDLLLKLRKLDLIPNLKPLITTGQTSIEAPFDNSLTNIDKTTLPLEVDSYLANLKKNLTFLGELIASLNLVSSNPVQRRAIYFPPATINEYNTLKAKSTLSIDEQKKVRDFETSDVNNQNEIIALSSSLQGLTTDMQTVTGKIKLYKETLNDLQVCYENISAKLFITMQSNQSAQTTTTADFVSRTGYYVSADIGLAYVRYLPQFGDEVVPYTGVNFHLGAINKQRYYKLFPKCNSWESLYKNTSIIVGVSFNTLASGRRNNSILAGNSLLTGFGLRISDPVRLSIGCIWNKIQSPNPLVETQRLQGYPYLALSYDLDVGKYLRIFGNKVFGINKSDQ